MYRLQQLVGSHWCFIAVRNTEAEIHRLLDWLQRRDAVLCQAHRYRIDHT